MSLTAQETSIVATLAKGLGIEPAALAAVVEVESNGVYFALVHGKLMPLIRWEGHYFYRFLKGAARDKAVKLKLASSTAGAIKNPSSQEARYDLLRRAAEIDEDAAYSSISVGVGQVMGSHASALGYGSAKKMLRYASNGFREQIEIMLAFIIENDLIDELQRRDWSAFARAYNGKNYAKHGYHTKLAKAYAAALKRSGDEAKADVPNASGMLRLGSKGARVREAQQLLVRAGFTVDVDGDFGPATKKAVLAFQRKREIEADGVVGPQTMRLLSEYRVTPTEKIGAAPISDVPEAVTGGGTAAGGVTVTLAAEKLNDVADKIHSSGGTFEIIANGLYVAGGALIVGGILWAGYGYLKSRRTYEGVVNV